LVCCRYQRLLIGQVVEQNEGVILEVLADRQISDRRDIEWSERIRSTYTVSIRICGEP
jgi:hypothetical protein